MLAQITSKHLTEWKAYSRLEPFDETRADYRSAIVASLLANAFSDKNKSFSPEDFMPDFEEAFVEEFFPEEHRQRVSNKIRSVFETMAQQQGD